MPTATPLDKPPTDSQRPRPPATPGVTRRHQYTATQRLVYRAKQTTKDIRFALNHSLLKNPSSRRLFAAQSPVLSDAQRRVATEIQTRGFSTIHVDELVGDPGCWRRLQDVAAGFVESEKVRRGVENYQRQIEESQWKEYLVRLIENNETVEPDHPLLAFALMPEILDTVNTALGLWAKLLGVTMWYTIPTDRSRQPMASQNWHRDPEDRNPIKLFLYFNEVDASNGALEYIPNTRAGHACEHLWPLAKGSGTRGYIPEEIVRDGVDPRDIVTASAGPGTLVFCDTSGFHRGGMARERERVMGKWAFNSPASLHQRVFQLNRQPRDGEMDPPARFALD